MLLFIGAKNISKLPHIIQKQIVKRGELRICYSFLDKKTELF